MLLVAAISLFACSKKNLSETEELVNVNKSAVAEVSRATNLDEQKSMYKLLNPNEKVEVWKQKYSILLTSNDYTTEQRLFIENLKKKLVPSLFSSESNMKNTDLNDGAIRDEAFKLFGVSETFKLLASVSGLQNRMAVDPGCGCSTSSDYCSGVPDCNAGFCQISGDGCGTLWLYQCNGTCRIM